jgi:hypothetical protein
VAFAAYPYPDASKTTLWSLCLSSARLTAHTAQRLTTAFRLIKNLHGLGSQEALVPLHTLILG